MYFTRLSALRDDFKYEYDKILLLKRAYYGKSLERVVNSVRDLSRIVMKGETFFG